MRLFQKIISYFIPITLKKVSSEYSGDIEINIIDGKKVMDTESSNYSFGSLQKILFKALKFIQFNQEFSKVLVLGLGGGSIIPTIREDFKSNAKITLIELDEKIIEIAKNEFLINHYSNIQIIHADAFNYVADCKDTFDLIIVDLFIIDTIPTVFTKEDFIKNLIQLMNPSSYLIYNTMRKTLPPTTFKLMYETFEKNTKKVNLLKLIQGSNDLIVAKK